MITIHDLSPNVEVLAGSGAAAAAPEVERAVAAAWRAARARRRDLFDGTLFSVERFSTGRIFGRFVPYRYLVAQRARPELFEPLRVRPLAVSGLLACVGGVVFGRRAAALTDDPGAWELAPSGGVDVQAAESAVGGTTRVNLRRQIMAELDEELGLKDDDISALEIFCAVEDDASHTIDIGIALSSPLAAEAVRARHAGCKSREYAALEIIGIENLPGFVAGLLAVSRALLERRGLIPRGTI